MPPLSFRIATATTTTTTMTTTMCVSQASSTSLWLFLSPFCRRQRNGRRTPCPVFSSFFFLLLLLLLLLLLHDSRRKRRRRKEKKKRKKDGIWAAPRRAVGGSKAELPVDVGDDSPTPSSSSFLLRSTIFSPGFRRKEEEEVGEEIREEEYRFRRRRKEGPLGIFFFLPYGFSRRKRGRGRTWREKSRSSFHRYRRHTVRRIFSISLSLFAHPGPGLDLRLGKRINHENDPASCQKRIRFISF